MPISRLNPPELHSTPGYHHVTVVTDARLVLLAGQCPLRPDGTTVGRERSPADTDLDVALAQTDQIVANTMIALRSVGATPADVVRTTIYVASGDQSMLAAVWERLNASPLAPAFGTASTLVGVAALGFIGQLVELDVTAALPVA
jgi:enamine deaminase RidA (YjgF/YER057c/UK114 family)